MSKQTEALKLALDWINSNAEHDQNCDVFYLDEDDKHLHCSCGLERVITAIRSALAEQPAQQEPVYYQWRRKNMDWDTHLIFDYQVEATTDDSEVRELYTSPPASKPWVGLTDEEKSDLWCKSTVRDCVNEDTHVFADAIEAKLRKKNS